MGLSQLASWPRAKRLPHDPARNGTGPPVLQPYCLLFILPHRLHARCRPIRKHPTARRPHAPDHRAASQNRTNEKRPSALAGQPLLHSARRYSSIRSQLRIFPSVPTTRYTRSESPCGTRSVA